MNPPEPHITVAEFETEDLPVDEFMHQEVVHITVVKGREAEAAAFLGAVAVMLDTKSRQE